MYIVSLTIMLVDFHVSSRPPGVYSKTVLHRQSVRRRWLNDQRRKVPERVTSRWVDDVIGGDDLLVIIDDSKARGICDSSPQPSLPLYALCGHMTYLHYYDGATAS